LLCNDGWILGYRLMKRDDNGCEKKKPGESALGAILRRSKKKKYFATPFMNQVESW